MKQPIRTTIQILSLAALAALCIYFLPRYNNPFKYHFEIGQPWGYGLVTAEYDFPIYKTETQLQKEYAHILKEYTPYFTLDTLAKQTNIYVVTAQDMERIQQTNCTHISIINNRISTPVPIDDIYTPKTAYQLLNKDVTSNLLYDSITSINLENNLRSSISLTHGIVQAGEKIIDTGEIVTAEKYQQLISLRHAMQEKNISQRQTIFSIIGGGICVILLLAIFYLYLRTYRGKLLDELRHILFFSILMAGIIVIAALVIRYAPTGFIYLVPFTWCPIITRVFYDSRTAIFVHLITIFIVSLAVPTPFLFLIIQFVAGVIAVISLRDMTQRAQLAQTAALILIFYITLYTAAAILLAGNTNDIDYKNYIYFAINAVLVICSYGLIFLFERCFGLISNITLVELTNVNSNLMLSFAEKAPGTFQHSLQVSNLATEAAKRIGAKVLLVRTGALYHDIGKMSNPDYFIENQTGNNPLQSMTTAEAAKIIINHVEEGERIARKHHLPEVILHFIRSHHGTSVTRYFYNTAVNAAISNGKTAADVHKEEYTYPGPKPSTKEAAILMMADAIEARSRTLKDLTEKSISDMVDQMIDTQVADGQFSETVLSFKDLEDIRTVFKQKLIEINHHRISYPAIEDNK
jgi:putative nucleotidyltransferase with HDIG domain